jgi:hypothetical protein
MLKKNANLCYGRIFLIFLALFQGFCLCAFAPTNFYQSNDSNWYLPKVSKTRLTVESNIEIGSNKDGKSWNSKSQNVLQLYDDVQKIIEMKEIHTSQYLFNKINFMGLRGISSNEQERRGHVFFTGNFIGINTSFFANYEIPFRKISGKLFVSCFLPIKNFRIKNLEFIDLTSKEPVRHLFNQRTSAFIQNLQTNVKYLADIDLSPTASSGLGDLTLLLNWRKGFRKQEEIFSNIYAFAKAGIDLPTGKKKNIDKVFSMALGNDGHWGMPFGVGGECLVIKQIKLGMHLDFLYLFSKTQLRRLKTAEGQTEFLLLNKGVAEMNPGFQWRVNPFVQAFRVYKGLSGKLAYQYIRHNRDKLKLKDEDFETRLSACRDVSDPNALINSINSLKRWSIHNAIFQINWDVAEAVKDIWGSPQVSVFYKQPFSGRNLINTNTFGGQLAVNF